MNILITGGAGNVGSNLALHLSDDNINQILIVDNLTTGFRTNIPLARQNVNFIKADVNNYSDIAPIIIAGDFDVIFHYAAVVGVKRTLNHPMMVFEDIEGMKNIFTLAKNTSVKRVFFSSSSEVYGEPVEIPQREDTTPLNSKLPYAIVKNVGESMLKAYYKEYGLQYTILRFFNTYGPSQSKDFVITKFINAALKNNDITIYGDGLQTRTFLYADDNSYAINKILKGNLFLNDTVNIGSDDEISILDLARKVIDVFNSKSRIIHGNPLAEGDMSRRQPDIRKIQAVMDFPKISLTEGLEKLKLSLK